MKGKSIEQLVLNYTRRKISPIPFKGGAFIYRIILCLLAYMLGDRGEDSRTLATVPCGASPARGSFFRGEPSSPAGGVSHPPTRCAHILMWAGLPTAHDRPPRATAGLPSPKKQKSCETMSHSFFLDVHCTPYFGVQCTSDYWKTASIWNSTGATHFQNLEVQCTCFLVLQIGGSVNNFVKQNLNRLPNGDLFGVIHIDIVFTEFVHGGNFIVQLEV